MGMLKESPKLDFIRFWVFSPTSQGKLVTNKHNIYNFRNYLKLMTVLS